MLRRLIIIATISLLSFKESSAQFIRSRDTIIKLSSEIKGCVGLAVTDLENNDTLSINGDGHFPMQSVFKYALAIYILHQVDQGKLGLTQRIHLSKNDVFSSYTSPIKDKYPDGNVNLSLAEILSYTVSQSDNNGCDKLFQLAGGTRVVNDYIHGLGIQNITIVATEREMGKSWPVQYSNWCTPKAMLELLVLFDKGNILSKSSHDFLSTLLTATTTGPARIRGLLPKGTLVAHKTGTSGTNKSGLTAATNDIGIVRRSGNKHFAIALFISDSPEDEQKREGAIAKITKVIWDSYKL